MAQSDGAAVDVDLAHVEVQLAGHSDGLSSESLVSLDQIDVLDGHASLSHSSAGSHNGADTHDLGINTALAPADQLDHGLQAVLLNSLAGGQHDSGSTVIDTGGVGGGHAGSALVLGVLNAGGLKGVHNLRIGGLGAHGESAAELCDAVSGDTLLGILIALELHDLLLDLHGDGNDLVIETAGVAGSAGLLLRSCGELILLAASDAPDIIDVLSGGAHVIVVESVPQAVLDHLVDNLLVAHTGAPAFVGQGVRSSTHVLGAAADHDVGVTGQDGTGTLDDRLHAGAADHAHGVSGNGIGDASLHRDLTGGVLALTGSEDAAEHQLVHVLGSDVSALQGFLDNDSAHVHGGGVLQRATKGADSGTAAIYDIKFFHVDPPFCVFLDGKVRQDYSNRGRDAC